MDKSEDLISKEHLRLRQKYNPDGSILRKNQLELLEMMQLLAEICRQNNITWWLSLGTLLGAARHHGFIPWDDDVDIVMMRKDYRRLEKILLAIPENESKYFFQTMRSDVEYVSVWGKLRSKEGCVKTSGRYRWLKYRGVGLDVFTLEKNNYVISRMAVVMYNNVQHLSLYIKNRLLRRLTIRFIEILFLGVVNSILRLFSFFFRSDAYRYSLGSGWARHRFYEKDIFPLKTALFEGVEFPVPNNTDAYLTNVYGDWRELPSEESIRKAIHCPIYIEEIDKRNNSGSAK